MSNRADSLSEPAPGFLRVAWRADVVRRGLVTAAVVGTILVAINHGDAIVRGDVPVGRVLRIVLTYCVPYAVATWASVQAIRAERPRSR